MVRPYTQENSSSVPTTGLQEMLVSSMRSSRKSNCPNQGESDSGVWQMLESSNLMVKRQRIHIVLLTNDDRRGTRWRPGKTQPQPRPPLLLGGHVSAWSDWRGEEKPLLTTTPTPVGGWVRNLAHVGDVSAQGMAVVVRSSSRDPVVTFPSALNPLKAACTVLPRGIDCRGASVWYRRLPGPGAGSLVSRLASSTDVSMLTSDEEKARYATI